jgi:hypothetical protein
MTFDIKKAEAKRVAFTALEIILDKNDPALDAEFALQADSYGTPKTTDDARAYTGADFRTYRYSDQQLFGVDHFPNLVKLSSSPPKIDPGKSIGFRATAKATIKDFISNDSYELPSPYDDRRVTGSHFLKLLARNHEKNRRARVIRGYDPFNYDEANCQIESYLIDSITLPDNNDNVSINMVDELILIEGSKSKIPEVSRGELNGDITAGVTTVTFSTTVTDEYGAVSATGYIVIEKEAMSYTVATSTTLTVVRGVLGTEAVEHKSGETIQKAIYFDDENIIDIFTTLINDHTNIPASYIPTVDWAALKAGDLANYNLTRLLYKPEDVKKVFNELIMVAGLSMYVDIVANEIVIVSVPDFSTPIITFNEDEHLMMDTIKVSRNYKEQITRQTIFWDKSNATEGDEEKNYTKRFQVIDGVVEVAADINNVSEPKAFKCNWLENTLEDNQLATSYAQRNINRFSQIPLTVKFDIDQRYIGTITGGNMWLGSIFGINTAKIVDGGLNNVETTCQCIEVKESNKDGHWSITGLSYIAATPPEADLYITEDKTDYLLTDELTTTEAREYVVVINSGVTLGASTVSEFAFDEGSLFAGATLKLYVLGRIVGVGGAGGTGANTNPDDATCSVGTPGNGSAGGDAMNLTTDTIIENGFGLIAAGGGGGAGNLGACVNESPSWFAIGGKGGGGGQGQVGGAGGAGGTGTTFNGSPGDAGNIAAAGDNGGSLGVAGGDVGAATGGAAGAAIQTNGNTVTIVSGNNSEQLKGAVI